MSAPDIDPTDVAEVALHAAFTVIQDKLEVETGDFAQAWVEPERWDSVVSWLAEYVKAEQAHLLTEEEK